MAVGSQVKVASVIVVATTKVSVSVVVVVVVVVVVATCYDLCSSDRRSIFGSCSGSNITMYALSLPPSTGALL